MTEEQKEKYANFLDKISEILGLNKPVDILRLCAVTNEYLRPIEKRIADLEWQLKEITEDNDYWQKENEELKKENAQGKEIIEELYYIIPASMSDYAKEPIERAKKFLNKVK